MFGERVRKSLQSELVPGGGQVPTRARAFMCWIKIAKRSSKGLCQLTTPGLGLQVLLG